MAESKYLKQVQGNGASTTLSSAISNSDTSAPLTSDTAFQGEGMVIIDEGAATEEFAYATGKVGSSLTTLADDRGLEGGSAQAHSASATVKGIITAGMWNNVIAAVSKVVSATAGTLLKATGATINTGTDDATIVTPKAIADSKVVIEDKTQTLTNKTLTSPLFQGTVDGWISANETWEYASANTITIPAGGVAKYAVGDRIRWKQGGAYKYGVIITVADTLLTIAINTDYTVATPTAITDNYYSHEASPIGYPQWFIYTPTWTAVAPMSFTSTDHRISRFNVIGKMCTVEFAEGGTTGGSASPSITMTLPIALTVSNTDYFATGVCLYEGTYETGTCINSNATVVRFQKYAGGNWGIGASRYIIGNLTYKIA